MVAAGAFYTGILVGMHSKAKHPQHSRSQQEHELKFEQRVQQRVQAILNKRRDIQEDSSHFVDSQQQQPSRFGVATSHFALGAARIDRDDFLETFHGGFPDNYGTKVDLAAQEALLFYNQPSALPDISRDETVTADLPPPKLTAVDATRNCHVLHVISTQSALPQCIALVPQHESFHIQRWMRINIANNHHHADSGLSKDLPLAPVGRGQLKNGINNFEIPSQQATEIHFQQLQTYLESLPSNLEQLLPLLKRVAVDNTVIVMVCNKGQADLLTNFACSNAARGFTFERILVFCTDQETCDIAEGLGMAAFYAKKVRAISFE
jgi:hypothetical protein